MFALSDSIARLRSGSTATTSCEVNGESGLSLEHKNNLASACDLKSLAESLTWKSLPLAMRFEIAHDCVGNTEARNGNLLKSFLRKGGTLCFPPPEPGWSKTFSFLWRNFLKYKKSFRSFIRYLLYCFFIVIVL